MRALVCLLLLAGVAAASPPPRPDTQDIEPTVFAGVGPRIATGYGDALDDRGAAAAAIELLLGLHMSPAISIGVHVGIAHHAYHEQTGGFGLHDDSRDADGSIVPLDVGLALQYARGNVALAPWVGRHLTRYRADEVACYDMKGICTSDHTLDWSNDFWSFGATASYDLHGTGANRLALFLAFQGHVGDSSFENMGPATTYAAVTFGLAYRHP